MTNNLPIVFKFIDLHLHKGRKAAKLALKGLSGIYAIIHIPSGRVYIGSSINLVRRLAEHLGYGNTNGRLQNSLAKHGLKDFILCSGVIFSRGSSQMVSKESNQANLLALEQKHLYWLFSLPEKFRYNFARVAEAPFTGLTHTPETLAQMSISQQLVDRSGDNNPMFGKTHTPETLAQMSISQQLVDRSGENNPLRFLVWMSLAEEALNPMFGLTPTNAMTVNVYSIDNVLVRSFTSQVACAKWLDVSDTTVRRYIKSGKVWNNLYVFRKSIL